MLFLFIAWTVEKSSHRIIWPFNVSILHLIISCKYRLQGVSSTWFYSFLFYNSAGISISLNFHRIFMLVYYSCRWLWLNMIPFVFVWCKHKQLFVFSSVHGFCSLTKSCVPLYDVQMLFLIFMVTTMRRGSWLMRITSHFGLIYVIKYYT